MNYFINLIIEDKDSQLGISVSENLDPTNISIDLFIPSNIRLEEVLKPENLIKLLKEQIKQNEELGDSVDAIKSMLDSDLDILDNCVSISINCDELSSKYVDKNKILQDMELHLNGKYEINHENLDYVTTTFGKHKNTLLIIDGNKDDITLSEYEKTVKVIDDIVSKIKKYDLSPLEQVMYAYDLVRDRVYTFEDKDQSYTTSRDLTSVLFGDKIVCVGYANIFEKVLNGLEIKNMMVELHRKNSNHGHMRNVIYLQDKKYNIDGVFYCDPTWDSKKKPDDLTYLDSYRFFCKSKPDMDKYSTAYIDKTFSGYEDGSVWEFEGIVEEKGIKAVPKKNDIYI